MTEVEHLTRVPLIRLVGRSSYSLQGAIEQHITRQFPTSQIVKEFASDIGWQIDIDERIAKQAIKDIFEISNGVVELKVKQ